MLETNPYLPPDGEPLRIVASAKSMAVAKTCLTVSIALFLLGFLVLCHCPEWYFTAAIIAAVGAFFGVAQIRLWNLLCCLACLLLAAVQLQLKLDQAERFRKFQEMLRKQEITSEKENSANRHFERVDDADGR